jgi:hypothetical protein
MSATDDEDLRVIALAAALECERPKAVTAEVLVAAEEILRFLKGLEAQPADQAVRRGATAH